MIRERVEHNGSDHQGRSSNGTGSIWRRRKRIPDMPAEEQAPSLSDELRTICAERGKRLSGRKESWNNQSALWPVSKSDAPLLMKNIGLKTTNTKG